MSERDIDAAVALLGRAGWTVIPPVAEGSVMPKPYAGQVWVSPKARVLPRTVIKIGPHQWWPYSDTVHFRIGDNQGLSVLPAQGWTSWARKSGARPALKGAA